MYNELGIIRKALFCFIREVPRILQMSKMALNPFCDETLHYNYDTFASTSPDLHEISYAGGF